MIKRHEHSFDPEMEEILVVPKTEIKYTPDKKEIEAEVKKWSVFHTELACLLIQRIKEHLKTFRDAGTGSTDL